MHFVSWKFYEPTNVFETIELIPIFVWHFLIWKRVYIYIYIYIYIYTHLIDIKLHWQHGFPWISLSICSYHPLLPVDLAGLPTLALLCVEVHRKILLMSSFLLFQQRPTCLAWMVSEMGAIQLLFYGVLLPRFVQNNLYHSCVVPI